MGLFLWSVVSLLLLQPFPITSSLEGPSPFGEAMSSPPTVLSTHSPIVIEGDENFTRENGVVSGNGTQQNPYVIENYTIRLNSSGTGILIKNTTKHFVIRNCTVIGLRNKYDESYGIQFRNVANGTIINSTLEGLYVGVLFINCKDVVVKNNTIVNFIHKGIDISTCNIINVHRNVMLISSNNISSYAVIYITSSQNINIVKNTLYNLSILYFYAIYVRSCKNVKMEKNLIDGDGIGGSWNSNCTIEDNIVRNATIGMRFVGPGKEVIIKNNRITRIIETGIFVSYDYPIVSNNKVIGCGKFGIYSPSPHAVMENNWVMNSGEYGIYVPYVVGNKIRNNTVLNGTLSGIVLFNSNHNIVHNNTVSYNGKGGDYSGIDLINSHWNVISNNTAVRNNRSGINLTDSHHNIIMNNTCSHNGFAGISLKSSDYTVLSNNDLLENFRGISVELSGWGEIYNCTLINNTAGIDLSASHQNVLNEIRVDGGTYGVRLGEGSKWNRVSNVTIRNATAYALELSQSENNTIKRNIVEWCYDGIHLIDSKNNVIYDNLFNCSRNYYLEGSGVNLWNVEKVESRNIVGGPYIGGNYWSDYRGEDIDGDGLGDTELPYGPGDYHPLLIEFPPPDSEPPWAVYVGDEEGRTGEEMNISFRIYDNRSLFGVVADLNFTFKGVGNVTIVNGMREGLRPDERGEISFNLSVPVNSTGLLLNLTLVDFSKNVGRASWYIPVNDTILPEIVEYSAGDFRTAENTTFRVAVRDNIGVGSVSVEYVMDCGDNDVINGTVILSEMGEGRYKGVLEIPVNARSIMYRYKVVDLSGNVVNTEWFREVVLDTVRPEVEFISEDLPETGSNYTMRFMIVDNIGVREVGLEVEFNGDIVIRPDLVSVGGGIWEGRVMVPENAVVLDYNLSVEDLGGNVVYLEGSIEVVDIIPPGFKDVTVTSPQTGSEYKMELNLWDNVGVEGGYVEWSYDGGEWRNRTFECGWISGVVRLFLGRVPENATVLHYRIGVVDDGGNWLIWEGEKVVEDVIAPVVELEIGEALTSHFLVVSLDVRDNIGVENVSFRYTFDDEVWEECESENYTYRIWLPSDVEHVRIRVEVYDVGGNRGEKEENIVVGDGTPPEILGVRVWEDDGNIRFEVYVKDNRESMLRVWVIIRGGDGERINITLEKRLGSLSIYEGCVKMRGKVRYCVYARDASGNVNVTEERSIEVGGGGVSIVVVGVVVLMVGVAYVYWRRRSDGEGIEE